MALDLTQETPLKCLWAYLALVRFLPGMDQEVFLQVGQLGEVLGAGLAPEGTLTAVHPQVNLQHESPEELVSVIQRSCVVIAVQETQS